MIYKFFRFWANIAIRVYYGKIEVSGIENIPKDVPVLIASNHPNGFLEPIIIACLFPRPLHFMVRGDVFRKKWLRPLLVRTNQIPIFRFKDGFTELRKNDANLQEAYSALDKGAAIILFIEGGTINIKKLRPFQKGLARMASSYLDKDGSRKDLHILPVAINFISPFVLRSRVVLNVSESFTAEDYFNEDSPRTNQIKKLTDDLYDRIKPLAFHVSKENRQDTLNKALKLTEGLFPLPFFPIVSYKTNIWKTLKSVANLIDDMSDSEFSDFEKDIDKLGKVNEDDVKRWGSNVLLNGLAAFFLAIPALVGLVVNLLPGLASQLLAKNVLDKDNMVFKASIILSSGVWFYIIYYSFAIFILSLFFGVKGFLFLLAWPLGFLYLFWENTIRSSILKEKYQLSQHQKHGLISLLAKHKIIHPQS